MGELALQGRDKVTFVVSPPIESFGLWGEQLVAESTGKHGKGILPVADEPLGAAGAYGDDRVFVYLRNPDEPEEDAGQARGGAGPCRPPDHHAGVEGAADLGRVFFFAEFATAVAGWVLGINPFDQPNVQEAKDNTAKVLEAGDLPDVDPGDLEELIKDAGPPHYLAVLGFAAPSEEIDAAVAELRASDPRRDEGHHDLRVRAALPPLHRADAQGRAAERPVPAARARRRRGRGDPGRRLHVRPPEEGPGDRRPAHAARSRPARRSGEDRRRCGRRGSET